MLWWLNTVMFTLINAMLEPPNLIVDPLQECLVELYHESNATDVMIALVEREDARIVPVDRLATVVWMDALAPGDALNWKFRLYILIVRNSWQLNAGLDRLQRNILWNARAKFVIVHLGNESPDTMLNVTSFYYAIHVALLINTDVGVEVYTDFPYDDNRCGYGPVSAVRLGICGQLPVGKHFPLSIPKNWMGCELRCAVNIINPFVMDPFTRSERSIDVGFESVLMTNLMRQLNISLRVVQTHKGAFGAIRIDGTFDGPLNELAGKEAEIAYGHIWPNSSLLCDFDITNPYFFDPFVWHVPAAKPGAQWRALLLIFNKQMWSALVAMLFADIVARWALAIVAGERKPLVTVALEVWVALLMGGTSVPRHWNLRVLFVQWALFGLLIGTAYQSQLLGLLMRPVYEHQVSTVEEMSTTPSIDMVYIFENIADFNDSKSVWYEREIIRRGRMINMSDYGYLRTHYQSDRAFYGSLLRTRFLAVDFYTDSDGNPTVYIFKEITKMLPVSMYLRRGHPLLRSVETITQRYMEAGFMDKWIRDTERGGFRPTPDPGPQKLVLKHLMSAFFVLFFGLQWATSMFFFELTLERLKRHIRPH